MMKHRSILSSIRLILGGPIKLCQIVENPHQREYPKVCVNLQTGVRYNYSVWRFLLWQEEKVTHHRKQQCAK